MFTDSVIEYFYVLEYCRYRFTSGCIFVAMNQLFLDGRKETFSNSIIPTIALSTHAALYTAI